MTLNILSFLFLHLSPNNGKDNQYRYTSYTSYSSYTSLNTHTHSITIFFTQIYSFIHTDSKEMPSNSHSNSRTTEKSYCVLRTHQYSIIGQPGHSEYINSQYTSRLSIDTVPA